MFLWTGASPSRCPYLSHPTSPPPSTHLLFFLHLPFQSPFPVSYLPTPTLPLHTHPSLSTLETPPPFPPPLPPPPSLQPPCPSPFRSVPPSTTVRACCFIFAVWSDTQCMSVTHTCNLCTTSYCPAVVFSAGPHAILLLQNNRFENTYSSDTSA